MVTRSHHSTTLAICARLVFEILFVMKLFDPLQHVMSESFKGFVWVISLKLTPIIIDFSEMLVFNFGYLSDEGLLAIKVSGGFPDICEDAIEPMVVVDESVDGLGVKDLGFPKIID